jgi:hypothetical protein
LTIADFGLKPEVSPAGESSAILHRSQKQNITCTSPLPDVRQLRSHDHERRRRQPIADWDCGLKPEVSPACESPAILHPSDKQNNHGQVNVHVDVVVHALVVDYWRMFENLGLTTMSAEGASRLQIGIAD